MTKRPYFNNRIDELEKIFRSSQSDLKLLEELSYELQFRNTVRAKKLFKDITKILSGCSVDSTKSLPNSGNMNSEVNNIVRRTKQPDTTLTGEENTDNEERIVLPPITKTNPVLSCDHSFQELDCNQKWEWRNTLVTPQKKADTPETDAVISAWLTQEILTPQPLPKEEDLRAFNWCMVSLAEIREPWKEVRFNKQGKETAVFWMVYLGEINLSKAMESILQKFPDEMADERSEVRGSTTVAVLVVDAQGRFVSGKAFLSSFAWGYGKVRAGQIKELASFADAERAIKLELEKRLIRTNEDGEVQPITAADLEKVTDWLIQELNLPQDEIGRPGSAIRVPQYGFYNEEAEPKLLNSFFIDDLIRIRDKFFRKDVGTALSTYLRGYSDITRQDIIRDKALLSKTLAPERIPLIRWPGPGRHPLYLMQQAAINHAISELADGGLIAVNGPPGTGKTTLLRDIVAKVVLDRAIAMAQFEKPEMAFKHIAPMKTGQAFSHLYQLDDTLLGHEIVVASSNNKAVENISREIPSSKALADDFDPPMRYFQTISDAVAAGEKAFVKGATWGLSAAVLGNAANRAAFLKSFWWDKQRGMDKYLSAIIGGNVPDNETDNEDGLPSIPEVVIVEKPPHNEIEALERWRVIRKCFLDKVEKVQNIRCNTQKYYTAVQRKDELIRLAEMATGAFAAAAKNLVLAEEGLNDSNILHQRLLETEQKLVEDRALLVLMRPGFFSRLFRARTYKDWSKSMLDVTDEIAGVRREVKIAAQVVDNMQKAYSIAKEQLTMSEREKVKVEREVEDILAVIAEGRNLIGDNFADESFWAQNDAQLQTGSPWIFSEFQSARDELFVAAFELHRAFIDAAAKYMRHNIRAVLELIKGRALTEKQEATRRSLWASLFMVVPVLSTTFASTSRLFGKLGREQLGWLLIDEAGQVSPQAVIGALWRAKRAIVIGDPLQIQPVAPMPPKLINAIFSEFNVPKDEWAAPDVSAQILADRTSWFGTTIISDDGDIWVGSPLRVHRRCQKPMFNISNHIAYSGTMVSRTPDEKSPIGAVLGSSTWINIVGDANGKWVRDEGVIAMKMLEKLFESGIEDPEVFFITPFRIVALELRQMIQRNSRIANKLLPSAWAWTNEHVGTVHTFQGKEADTVVFVLGAPLDSSSGARRWAGEAPNLLNVAMTRAKRRVYVVGSHKAWKNAGYFQFLATSLPVVEYKTSKD